MKTIRITYPSIGSRNADITKWFAGPGVHDPQTLNNHHLHFVSDLVADLLVPDTFDPNPSIGNVSKPNHTVLPHIFMGHENTPAIIDKNGNTEPPVPLPI